MIPLLGVETKCFASTPLDVALITYSHEFETLLELRASS